MWYAVETAFIKGEWYKSIPMFHNNVDPGYCGVQPGVCLAGTDEKPHNTVQKFINGDIEIHGDWFQTIEQALQFINGNMTYVVHMATWYDSWTRSVRSSFIKWETIPTSDKYAKFRGVYKHHYRYNDIEIPDRLLQALIDTKNGAEKEAIHQELLQIGVDNKTADILAAHKKGQQ